MSEIELFAKVQELLRAGTPFVLVTLVSIKGSAPQDLGAKAIITREGILQGTVGGGKLEAKAIRYAQQMLEESPEDAKQLCTWNLQLDLGMTCGGEASMFFDGDRKIGACFDAGVIGNDHGCLILDKSNACD